MRSTPRDNFSVSMALFVAAAIATTSIAAIGLAHAEDKQPASTAPSVESAPPLQSTSTPQQSASPQIVSPPGTGGGQSVYGNCPPGEVFEADGLAGQCVPEPSCPKGQWFSQSDPHGCVPTCGSGQKNDPSTGQCENICGKGAVYNPSPGPSQSTCSCPKGWLAAANGSCAPCPSGQVLSPAGNYCIKPGACSYPQIYNASPTSDADICGTCPAGTHANATQNACVVACAPGQYAAQDFWVYYGVCTPCPSGTVSDAHNLSCVSCGKYAISNSQHTACVTCDRGKEPSSDHSRCVACTGDTFSNGMECVRCSSGGKATANHTSCVGPGSPPQFKPPLTTETAKPGSPIMNPGLLEGTPGLGTQGPAGIGSRPGGARGPAAR